MTQDPKKPSTNKMDQDGFVRSLGKFTNQWNKALGRLKKSHSEPVEENVSEQVTLAHQEEDAFTTTPSELASHSSIESLEAGVVDSPSTETLSEIELPSLEEAHLVNPHSEKQDSLAQEPTTAELLEKGDHHAVSIELTPVESIPLDLAPLAQDLSEHSSEHPKVELDSIAQDSIAPGLITNESVLVSTEETSSVHAPLVKPVIKEQDRARAAVSSLPAINAMLEPAIEDKMQEDLEFLALVIEEVDEYMPSVRSDFESLKNGQLDVVSRLYRSLHTIKGSVGQFGARRARGLFHVLESMIEEIQARPSLQAVNAKIPVMQVILDAASSLVDGMRENRFVAIPSLTPEAYLALPVGLQQTIELEKAQAQLPAHAEQAVAEETIASKSSEQRETTVRVRASAVDHLLNQSNELKLAHSGLKNGLTEIATYMKDLDENGERLSHMLREIEIHADSQIQARRLEMETSAETFDPLEFDRFTRLQELARFMAEGLNDISQIRQGLQRIAAEQEARLTQQDRSLDEIQEGLGKTRLTSIEKALSDGLTRTARQTSLELNKPIDFEILGGNIEVDRVLLEKLSGPLSHVLRNSLSHGIEETSVRHDHGKPKSGKITIQFKLESGRLRVTCSDDGAGLNLNAIRNKAISKGMWKANTPMSVHQAVDIICTPRFSTAENVSELAGRGVGMDVVRTSIVDLGGRFSIDSVEGKGLTVNMLIPTSLSNVVSLVVFAGDQRWSLPTESVAQVQVIRGEELKTARQKGEWTDAQGQVWPYISLVERLGLRKGFDSNKKNAFVVSIQEKDQRLAVEVDKIQSVQELALRPLGKAWARLPGVLGSTLMPDGEAIFLIDLLRLPILNIGDEASITSEHRLKNVLVVDDSLTVRRHCERLLSENGYRPILVKDGREALDYLTSDGDQVDLVLLDVEMPKMDGFELTRQIRADAKLKHLPLIMITSRTAEKHRNYGLQLGVNAYMGKPIKDDELLEAVRKWG